MALHDAIFPLFAWNRIGWSTWPPTTRRLIAKSAVVFVIRCHELFPHIFWEFWASIKAPDSQLRHQVRPSHRSFKEIIVLWPQFSLILKNMNFIRHQCIKTTSPNFGFHWSKVRETLWHLYSRTLRTYSDVLPSESTNRSILIISVFYIWPLSVTHVQL